MLTFAPASSSTRLQRVLVVGAHSDDIEIGCGGTILRLVREYPELQVRWVVMSAHGERRDEAYHSAEALLARVNQREVVLHAFRDGYLPYAGGDVKDCFETLKVGFEPDLILTHHGGDAHQDHRLVSELTWNTFRDHQILEFEIPKYDGDLGRPNFFVPLDAGIVQSKMDHLLTKFPSQQARRWFTEDLFRSLLRLRGMECNSASGYAEAFYCRKMVF